MTSAKTFGLLGIAFISALICSETAKASIAFDANVASGVYYGTGNVNGGFTVDTEAGIQIGLRAKLYKGSIIDSPTDMYNVPTGLSPLSAARAAWNYDFSYDLSSGSYTFATITSLLTITDQVSGNTVSFDPLNPAFGNATQGTTGQQNSENPLFVGLMPPGYNVNALDTYTFVLDVFAGTNKIASDTIVVNAVPEPSAIALTLGGGLLVFLRRRSFGFARK